jgi:ABC-type antimicrobial peptide transport system permease subunit
VRHEGVTLFTGCELGLLHHVDVVLHAFAAGIGVGELEGVESAKLQEKTIEIMGIVAFEGAVALATHRPPNCRQDSAR